MAKGLQGSLKLSQATASLKHTHPYSLLIMDNLPATGKRLDPYAYVEGNDKIGQ